MDYLLLGEGEFSKLNLGEKEHLLWVCIQKIEFGENAIDVAVTAIETGLLTSNDFKMLKTWMKKNRPKRKKRDIDVIRRRGVI